MESHEHINKPIDAEKLLELRAFLSAKKAILGEEQYQHDKVEFIRNMRATYDAPTLNASALYHIIIESTPKSEADITTLDLPNNDIEKFIRGEL